MRVVYLTAFCSMQVAYPRVRLIKTAAYTEKVCLDVHIVFMLLKCTTLYHGLY